jgi:hypothetical protein
MRKYSLFFWFCLLLFFMAQALCAQSDSGNNSPAAGNKEQGWKLSIIRPSIIFGPPAFDVKLDGVKVAEMPNNSTLTLLLAKDKVTVTFTAPLTSAEIVLERSAGQTDAYVKTGPRLGGLYAVAITREEFEAFKATGNVTEVQLLKPQVKNPPIDYEQERVRQLAMRLNHLTGPFTFWDINTFNGMGQATNEEVDAKIEFGEKTLKGMSERTLITRIIFCSLGTGLGTSLAIATYFLIPYFFTHSGDPFRELIASLGNTIKWSCIIPSAFIAVISFIFYFIPSPAENENSSYRNWLSQYGKDNKTSAVPFIELSPVGLTYGLKVSF